MKHPRTISPLGSDLDSTFRTSVLGLLLAAVPLLVGAPVVAQSPSLGSATGFAVLAGTTVTNAGPSNITGDVGVAPATAITGFPPGIVTGTLHPGTAAALQAQADVAIAYNSLLGAVCTTTLTGQDLGGMTLTPGVYCFATAAQLTGTLTLDALGNPAAVFVIQIGSTLTTATAASVALANGADANHVFWQVGSSATLGATTAFAGNVIALASITLAPGASLTGRALARSAAVTMDTNSVALPAGALAQYYTFGAGCAGSLGITSLTATALPRIGQTMTIQLDQLPQNLAFLTAGFSNTASSFGALPLALASFGMPGCSGRVSPDQTRLVSGASNAATLSFALPNQGGLLGLRFYHQALVIDASAGNPLGAVMSDAATGVIGN